MCAAACSSGPSPKDAVRRPAPSSPRVSSSIWIATASRSAIWSGKPTTAVSSKATSPKPSATASMSAFRPQLTPIRATSKPCIASKKTSSSIWKTSPAAATSSPRPTPISSISISSVPTRTKKIRALGRSSSGSLPARRSNSACFHLYSWITTSTTQGDTMCLGIPSCGEELLVCERFDGILAARHPCGIQRAEQAAGHRNQASVNAPFECDQGLRERGEKQAYEHPHKEAEPYSDDKTSHAEQSCFAEDDSGT